MILHVVEASILEGYSTLAIHPRMVHVKVAIYNYVVVVIEVDEDAPEGIYDNLRPILSMRPMKRP